jgi:hypothetical protein
MQISPLSINVGHKNHLVGETGVKQVAYLLFSRQAFKISTARAIKIHQ